MAKLTVVLDDVTAATLRATAAALNKSQSLVVREAVADYAARAGRLTTTERRRLLGTVDAMMRRTLTRTAQEVTAELRAVRQARRQGGRTH